MLKMLEMLKMIESIIKKTQDTDRGKWLMANFKKGWLIGSM